MMIIIKEHTKEVTDKCLPPANNQTWSSSSSLHRIPLSQVGLYLLFSMIPHGVGHPFDQFGSVVLALSHPSLLPTGQCEKLKILWLNRSTAEQQLKHRCVTNIILNLNPKDSTILTSRKKINSVAAKTRTRSNLH